MKGSSGFWSPGGIVAPLLLAGFLCLVSAGCGPEGGVEGETGLQLLETDSPLKSPIWSSEGQAVYAIHQDGDRLVRAEVGGEAPEGEEVRQATTLTAGLDGGIGESLAADLAGEGSVYVPQPEADQVVVVDREALGVVRTHDVGPAPERVTVDARGGAPAGDNVLFALGADHSTITGTNLESGEIVFQEDAQTSEDTLIEAARTGANAELWTAGPEGVSYYSVGGLRRPVGLGRGATALAVQPGDATRAFIGGVDGTVTAVQATSGLEMNVGEEGAVGGRVEVLTAEEDGLYAATAGRLVVLDPENLERQRTIEFADARQDFADAVPSGIAVSEQSVYVTFEGRPYMLEVEKS